jgi:FMN phosphatase YigB (HAD superfamily)
MLSVVNSHMIITYQRKDVRHTISYSHSLLSNKASKSNDNDNDNDNTATTYIYPDDIAINSLDIADGLKELLIKYGFTLEALSNMPSSELAESLGIDQYIAKIICSAARKLSDDNYAR